MYFAACFVEMQNGIVSLICFAVTEEASNDVHHCMKLPLPEEYPTVLDCIKSCERLLQERYFIFSDKVYFYVKNTAASSVLVKEPEGTKTIGIDGRDVYRNYLLMEEDQFDKSRRDFDKRYEESMQGMNREEKKGVIGWGMNESCSRDSEIEFVSMRAMSEPDSFWLSVSVDGEPYLLLVSAMPYQRSSSIMKVAFSLFSSTENKTIGSFLLDYSSRANRFPPYLLLVFLDNSRKVLIFRLVNTSTFANDKYEYDFRTSQSSEDFRRNVGSTLSFSSTPRPPDIVHSLRMPNASIFLYFGDLQPVPASPDGSVYSSTAGEDAMSFRAWSEPWGSDSGSQGSGLSNGMNGSGLSNGMNGSGLSNGLVGSGMSNGLVGSGMSNGLVDSVNSNLVGSGMSSNLIGNGLVLGGLRWRPSPTEVVATGHGLAFDRRGELLYYGDFAQNRFHGAGRQVNPMCFGHHVLRARFVCDMPVGAVSAEGARVPGVPGAGKARGGHGAVQQWGGEVHGPHGGGPGERERVPILQRGRRAAQVVRGRVRGRRDDGPGQAVPAGREEHVGVRGRVCEQRAGRRGGTVLGGSEGGDGEGSGCEDEMSAASECRCEQTARRRAFCAFQQWNAGFIPFQTNPEQE